MKAKDLLLGQGELSHKTRTIKDLVRFINTRENADTSNYSLFLGAGASRSSGIATASELIEIWMQELYERYENKSFSQKETGFKDLKDYFEHKHSGWYNSLNPYSSLFEKKFDLPTQRRRFVEQQVDKKLPSIGYAYLVSLVENNFFNTIFTTNFDDLLNESFYQLSSTRPIICAHDSSVHSISITSKRPKILKLHGDYLFEDIKSTLRETESLEQNIKDKLIEFCKEFGLIIIGYSGSDRSIMDVVDYLIKRDSYLKNGIYWCFRGDDEINQTVKNLLWKDRVYPIIIDGFDEFFAEIYKELIGEYGEIYNSDKETQRDKILSKIINDFSDTKNEIIRKEVEELSKNRDRVDISNLINFNHSSDKEEKLSLKTFRNMLEISKIEKTNPEKAYNLCKEYYENESYDNNKSDYLRRLISLSKMLGRKSDNQLYINELINTDLMNPDYRSLIIDSLKNNNDKKTELSKLTQEFPYSHEIINQYIDTLIENLEESNLPECKSLLSEIEDKIEKSLNLNPSLSNIAILRKHKVLSLKMEKENDKNKINEIEEKIKSHIKEIKLKNRIHYTHVRLLSLESERHKNIKKTYGFLDEIMSIREEVRKEDRYKINNVINMILKDCLDYDESNGYEDYHSKFYNEINEENHNDYSCKCLIGKVLFCLLKEKDVTAAKNYLSIILKKDNRIEHMRDIIDLLYILDKESIQSARKYIEDMKNRIDNEYYLSLISHIYSCEKDFDNALLSIEKLYESNLDLDAYLTSKTYYLLKSSRYDDVVQLMEKYKKETSSIKFDVSKINLVLAKKEINHNYNYNEELRNIISKTKSKLVKIAGSILTNEHQGYSDLKRYISRNPYMYFEVIDWVFIDQDKLKDVNPLNNISI